MTKKETAFRNWENNRENENITYHVCLGSLGRNSDMGKVTS